MKRALSLILTLAMLLSLSAAAFAFPGTAIGNKLTATVNSVDSPKIIWDREGDPTSYVNVADALGITIEQETINGVPALHFNAGDILSTKLDEMYTEDFGGSWYPAYVTWYVKVPEGATHVHYGTAIPMVGQNPIPLDGSNPDGQVVVINGVPYLKVIAQFACKTGVNGQWVINYSKGFEAAKTAVYPIHFGTKVGDTWTELDFTTVHHVVDCTIVEPAANITLSWATGEGILTPSASGQMTVNAGYTFKMGVRLQNTGTGALAKGLVVMTIKDATGNAVMSGITASCQGVSIGKGSDYYYWGPSAGFEVGVGHDATSIFDVKIQNAGTYSVEIFVVDLNAN